MRVSVIGGSTVDEQTYDVAYRLGTVIADRGHTVVCGGLTGVMEGVARGVQEEDGHVIGIVPGTDRSDANPYVDTVIATGLGHARNPLVSLNGDGVVAVDGGPGTLSEIGHALVYEKPIAGLNTHEIPDVRAVDSPEAAVDYLEAAVGGK